MADRRHPRTAAPPPPPTTTTTATTQSPATFLRKLQTHIASSSSGTQLIAILTLLTTGSILLLLSGLTVTVSVLGFIFLTPIIIISSPIWVPIGLVLFVVTVGFLSVFGFVGAVVAGLSWMYRYFIGMHPVGSDRVDYARTRIYDTARHVKDYARDYGGYLQSKVKDAAPGA